MKVQPVHFITVCLLTYNLILTCFHFFSSILWLSLATNKRDTPIIRIAVKRS